MACKDAVRWVYKLEHSYWWQSPYRVGRDYAFRDKKGRVRLVITAEGLIVVTRGYAWDGCTPKVCVLDLVLGTPDGVVSSRTGRPKTYHASLVHDALYQFLPDGLPLTRAQADRCFLLLMSETGFRLRYVYYLAVRALGWLVLDMTRRCRDTYGATRDDLTGEIDARGEAARHQPGAPA